MGVYINGVKMAGRGRDGSDGKSAYELAVESGFSGSEEEWLASLKGEPGKDGIDGEGVPSGGTDGQVLTKEGDVAVWADPQVSADSVTQEDVDSSISTALEPIKTALDSKQDIDSALTMEEVNTAIDTAIQSAVLESWSSSY